MKLKHLKHTDILDFFAVDETTLLSIPMFSDSVQAGFPSPAEDHLDLDLNLNDYLVQNPSATFCVKAIGESMKDAGIKSGDIMIVDKSLEPKNRSIVLAVIDGEFTVKRVNVNNDELYLMPENSNFPPIKITEEMDFQVWGIVTYIIHKAV
jgi:DNA polymerase V|tara:strand:+ start:125 stop:577 length:453 start_codon:yes stop_codon:yes gene_type:complete